MAKPRKRPVASATNAPDDAETIKLALSAARPHIRSALEAAVVMLRDDWEVRTAYLACRGWRMLDSNEWQHGGCGPTFKTRDALRRQVRSDLSGFAWLADGIRQAADRAEVAQRPALHRAESVVPKHPFADTDDDDL